MGVIPCPPGASYQPLTPLPGPLVRYTRLTSDQAIERHKLESVAEEARKGAAGGEQVKLLDAGMKAWLANAKRKWLEAGGYGFPLTEAERAEIRAAGFEPRG